MLAVLRHVPPKGHTPRFKVPITDKQSLGAVISRAENLLLVVYSLQATG
jgi:hypothetical protein